MQRLGMILLLAFSFMGMAHAQMVTGEKLEDFDKTFGITGPKSKDFLFQQLSCSSPGNLLWPEDSATFTFRFENKTAEAFKGPLKIEVIQYGTRGRPNDIWKPQAFKIADIDSQAIPLEVAPKSSITFEVHPKIGSLFGGYALIADLGPLGRQFLSSCARVGNPDLGKEWLPTYALDLPRSGQMSEEVFAFFQRLGVKGARSELGYLQTTAKDFDAQMQRFDQFMQWSKKYDLTVMLTLGGGNAPQPLKRGRPWLNADGTMKNGVKEDLAWLPEYDPDFQKFVTLLCNQYGWPKGPVNAVELWNEPWEGVSISGWGADIPRYREIYRSMALGVEAARKESSVKVLIGGACSSTNTRDKLFCDGSDEFLKWLDFVSIHYQPMAADPVLQPQWVNRKSEFGPVKVWDTESWVANSDDRVAAVIASMRAQGQSRTAGIYAGNVYDPQKFKVDGKEYGVVQAWSAAASVSACQRFIGQRPFKELLFKNGLPWIFVFEGRPVKTGEQESLIPDDGSIVILGDLGEAYDKNRTPFRSVLLDSKASLSLADGGGKFILHDFYGNPLPAQYGRISVPLNGLGYFLRTDGSAGSFEKMLNELKASRIEGYTPVEVVARDFTAPIEKKPALRVQLTNILNHPISGKLTLKLGDLTLEKPELIVSLNAHETQEFTTSVTNGASNATNAYKLELTFDAGTDGKAQHIEALHVNFIAKKTITVDGKLDDWSGVVAQNIGEAQRIGASLTEKAYLPFQKWDDALSTGSGTAMLAYDDQNFYFAAKAPGAPGELPRFETRNDDQYFYPDKVTEVRADPKTKQELGRKELSWPEGVRHFSYARDFEIPSGNGRNNIQIAFNVRPLDKKDLLPNPPGTFPKFMIYQDTDYEFALNRVSEKAGGGAEVFCLQKPGMWRKMFFPRQPKAPNDGGPVKSAPLVAIPDGANRIIECAIPWAEMPEVKAAIDANQPVKFSFRVNDGKTAYELAVQRSVSKENNFAFHNDWTSHWANELEFGYEK